MKSLLALVLFLLSSLALAAGPQWARTLSWPYLGNEFSTTPPQGGCATEAGCFRVENWTQYWLSPGLPQVGNAGPGRAPVVDANGVVMGVYVGDYALAGEYQDAQFGRIPAITGDFRPALGPKGSGRSDKVYLTVDPGVTEVAADAIQFRAEALPMGLAYDVRFGRVVSYQPGRGTVVKTCAVYNDVTNPVGSPDLAAFTNGSCH